MDFSLKTLFGTILTFFLWWGFNQCRIPVKILARQGWFSPKKALQSLTTDIAYTLVSRLFDALIVYLFIKLAIQPGSGFDIQINFGNVFFETDVMNNFTKGTIVWFLIPLFDDASRWSLHLILHRVPFLWKFHLLHHEIKILTPFSRWRIHPVELVLYKLRYAFVFLFTLPFIASMIGMSIISLSLGIVFWRILFYVAGGHLRHSHIPIDWSSNHASFKWIGLIRYIFISPRMHQQHHIIRSRVVNMGSQWALWDLIYGSLFMSQHKNKPDELGS